MSFSQSHWELLEMLQLWSLGSETLGVSEHKYLVVFFPSSTWILQCCFVLLNTCFHQCALKYILIKRQKVNRLSRLECRWSRGGRVSHVSHQVFYNIPLGIFCVWPLPNKRKEHRGCYTPWSLPSVMCPSYSIFSHGIFLSFLHLYIKDWGQKINTSTSQCRIFYSSITKRFSCQMALDLTFEEPGTQQSGRGRYLRIWG